MKLDLEPSALGQRPHKSHPDYKVWVSAYMREYRKRRRNSGAPMRDSPTPEQNKLGRLSRYGLTPETFSALLESQGYGCAICATALLEDCPSRNTHIDHCHTTGKVRGILCSGCNLGLGHFKDDPRRLTAAASYLVRS